MLVQKMNRVSFGVIKAIIFYIIFFKVFFV